LSLFINFLYDCLASVNAISAKRLLTAFDSISSLELKTISSGFTENLSLISDKPDKRLSIPFSAM
jgi:hypothetical protein